MRRFDLKIGFASDNLLLRAPSPRQSG